MPEQNMQPQQIQVKANDEILKGEYATMVQIGHGSEEFVLDFINHMPPAGQLVSRIIVSPSHFKRVFRAMEQNLKNYEEQFGTIQLQVVPDMKVNFDSDPKTASR